VRSRQERWGRIVFCAGWFGALGLAVRAGATSRDTNPEHLLGLLPAAYLAAWGPFFALSPLRPAGKAARFLACTLSMGLALGLFELPAALRLVDYRAVFSTPTPSWRRPGNLPDPELIYVRKGNERHRLRFIGSDLVRLNGAPQTTYVCDLRLDGRGFRNPTDLPSADVVVVGDSFIEGLQVAEPELVSARLGRLLGASVANLGRTGYGPQQELGVLRRYGVSLRPRTCVWAFYEGNDLQDAGTYGAEQRQASRALREPASKESFGRSFTRNGLDFAIRRWLRPEPTRPARLQTGWFNDTSGARTAMYFSCADYEAGGLSEASADGPNGWKRVRSVLADAHALCAREGIDLVVVFIPTKFRVYRDLCTFDPQSPCTGWPVGNLPGALKDGVASISDEIGFLDLTPRLQAEAKGGAVLYLPDDTHWSAEGHRSTAVAVAEFLTERRATHRPGVGRSVETPQTARR